MKRFIRYVAVFSALLFFLGITGHAQAILSRHSGEDRYITAVEISKAGWESGADTVILARGDLFADALAGVPLAHLHDAPVLLTGSNQLPAVVENEIVRLGVKKVFILGGKVAVAQSVEERLDEMGLEIVRVAGDNRYGTARKIAALVAPKGAATVFLASGGNFPDALAAASYAAAGGHPILLTHASEIPGETQAALEELNPGEVVVVGGANAIGKSVTAKLSNFRRIFGADRYGTALALAEYYASDEWFFYVASGLDAGGGADALTGAVLAAKRGTGVLLVGNRLPDEVAAFLGKKVEDVRILGGTAAISTKLAKAIEEALYVPTGYPGTGRVRVKGITVNPETMLLVVGGETGAITATIEPARATNKKITWATSDEEVATVSNGIVTPVGPGSATITATTKDGGYTAACNVTVKAARYTVIFDANGGTVVPESMEVPYNSTVSELPVATREGHTFLSWNTQADGNGDDFTVMTVITGDITVYAQWTVNQYTITFDSAGGSPVDPITRDYGTEVIPPSNPTREGHTFAGWNPVVPATMPAENTTCVAQWSINQYTITFNSNGGSPVAPITQNYGTAVTPPSDPTREGHTFNGWEPAVPATMPAEDTTCVAQWTPVPCTITFDPCGGIATPASCVVSYGSPIGLIPAAQLPGYGFLGWFTESGGLGSKLYLDTVAYGDIMFYANWAANTDTPYKVEHYQQDVSGTGYTLADTDNLTGTTDTTATAVAKSYVGFQENASHSGRVASGTINGSGNLVLKLYYDRNTYTVNFDSNGGSDVTAITGVRHGAMINSPASPTRTGHDFDCWCKDAALANPWSFASDTVTAGTTLYARWAVNQYTITFNSNGGSPVAAITQDYGTAVTAPADPTREGYSFIGWNPAVPATMPGTDTTCVAQWAINQYTITFNSNGGSPVAAITQDYGTAVTAPADPTREGHTFNGWEPAVPTTMPAENTTCVAQWSINQYTITFNSNGGSPVAPITQNYGTAVTPPSDPTREGHTFNGWEPAVPATMPAEDTTCVAQWTPVPCTITFDPCGGIATPASCVVSYGSPIGLIPAAQLPGYGFLGWFTESGGLGSKLYLDTVAYGDITFYANWAANTDTPYKVEHYQQDVSGTGYTLADTDNLTGTTDTTATAAAKSYVGFQENASHSGRVASGTINGSGNLVLKLYYDRNTYTVNFDSNGGSDVTAITGVRHGAMITSPADPTKPGFVFAGWYTDAALANEYDFSTVVTTGFTLYAKWTAGLDVAKVNNTQVQIGVSTLGTAAVTIAGGDVNTWKSLGDIEIRITTAFPQRLNTIVFTPAGNLLTISGTKANGRVTETIMTVELRLVADSAVTASFTFKVSGSGNTAPTIVVQ